MFGKMRKILIQKLDQVNNMLEKSNLIEINYLLGNKKQIFLRNLFAGISRGIGIGIGVTVITAILVIVLRRIVMLNIPVIGEFVSDIVDIVETRQY